MPSRFDGSFFEMSSQMDKNIANSNALSTFRTTRIRHTIVRLRMQSMNRTKAIKKLSTGQKIRLKRGALTEPQRLIAVEPFG